MKILFFPKLALEGIRKNKRMYLPYLLTCIAMVMMYYIIIFLRYENAVSYLSGSEFIYSLLSMAGGVIAFFACILLFYSNSFLMRRRRKEFGLYNILGMGKGSIGHILFWETLIIACISLGIGLTAGVVFSKLAELGLINILRGDITYTLSVYPRGIVQTIEIFGLIFALLFAGSLIQVKFSSAISLLRSENVGEKPPKANWLSALAGLIILGAAYYIAVTISNPVAALTIFFVAVIMVIGATYLLMIAGSVTFCRLLQKNKRYYYKASHFVSVSSMAYRMKRNGAGLASICILATMVLVMVSTTACLYFGEEDMLRKRYPREINLEFRSEDTGKLSDEKMEPLKEAILKTAENHGIQPENFFICRNVLVAGYLDEDQVETDVTLVDDATLNIYSSIYEFYFVPLADYNAMMGTQETLASGEALLHIVRGSYQNDRIAFHNGQSFRIKKQVEDFVDFGGSMASIIPSMVLVVPDLGEAVRGLDRLADFNGNRMISICCSLGFDTGKSKEEQIALGGLISGELRETLPFEEYGFSYLSMECRQQEANDFYGLYGGFFYLGILLSIVFLLATVLIIYYKQITEGFEDQARFEIMQKVGMTKKEIRKSINSQLLTVFFLPLIFAALHLVFAFPILSKLLMIFGFQDLFVFAFATAVCFCVFALFYICVYRLTSNAYYNIVSGARED